MLRSLICAAALATAMPAVAATINLDFGQSVPAGSPSVYTLTNSFTLPAGFSNASLTIETLAIDDRGLLLLNGATISDAGIFGPGDGFITLTPGGSNDPYTFSFGNGVQDRVVTTDFIEGLNTLSILVNDTNQGIFGAPLASVNISGASFTGFVTFDVGADDVAEPATLGLLGIGFLGAAVLRRTRRTFR